MVGENNPFYGKHHSDEAKLKNSLAHKGKITVNKDGKIKMINADELEYYLQLGYKRGRK